MRVIGYSYKADIYCPEDVVREVCKDLGIEGHGLSHIPEESLDRLATTLGINRQDERTFDSGEFPKVIMSDYYDKERDICCVCWTELMEAA